jgi:gliding motility-associated lipoprotein GldD
LYNEEFKSTIFISFLKINNNFNLIKSDFNIKINENSKNAFVVNTSEYSDPKKRVFAKYFSFKGNTPANTHFFITDSVSSFLTGSLYFESKPNYDSLIPYINYTNNDIRKMIQSFKWN